jgi:hypothetical protein
MAAVAMLWLPWTIRMFVGYFAHAGWRGVFKYLMSEAALRYAVFFGVWAVLELVVLKTSS